MKLTVDRKSRLAKMRAHTAAHLLHAELEHIINWTKQAWSYVDEDYLRFDFSTPKALTSEEISLIEKNINNIIFSAYDVVKKEMSFDEAIKLWAKAFFEDKYGDTVRVISIKDDHQEKFISVELCGGTHANNTADLWAFKIISQEAVASWIRRITAITGTKLLEDINEKDTTLNLVAQKLQADTPKQILEKLDKTMKEFSEVKSAYESVQTQMIWTALTKLANNSTSNESFDIILALDESLSNQDFKSILNKAREQFSDKNVIIYNKTWNFWIFTTTKSAKEIAQKYALKWWWSDKLFQGRDENVLKIS